MAKIEKIPNYTTDQIALMVRVYSEATTDGERAEAVDRFAKMLVKSNRSIIAKLSSEGVYVKAERVGKTGVVPEKKEEMVEAIARLMGVDADSNLQGLEKANKTTLTVLRAFIQASIDFANNVDADAGADVDGATI